MISLMKLSTPQLLFIIIVPIVVSIIAFLFIFLPARRHYRKKYFVNVYYKTVRAIAVNQDYYLINNFKFKISDTKKATFNHVLFGDKYIYLILSNHYDGDLVGKEEDKYLVMVPKKGKKKYVSNPYLDIKRLTERFIMNTSLD